MSIQQMLLGGEPRGQIVYPDYTLVLDGYREEKVVGTDRITLPPISTDTRDLNRVDVAFVWFNDNGTTTISSQPVSSIDGIWSVQPPGNISDDQKKRPVLWAAVSRRGRNQVAQDLTVISDSGTSGKIAGIRLSFITDSPFGLYEEVKGAGVWNLEHQRATSDYTHQMTYIPNSELGQPAAGVYSYAHIWAVCPNPNDTATEPASITAYSGSEGTIPDNPIIPTLINPGSTFSPRVYCAIYPTNTYELPLYSFNNIPKQSSNQVVSGGFWLFNRIRVNA